MQAAPVVGKGMLPEVSQAQVCHLQSGSEPHTPGYDKTSNERRQVLPAGGHSAGTREGGVSGDQTWIGVQQVLVSGEGRGPAGWLRRGRDG